ncbi:Aste57867_3357 [Aphanomyces stellatus]|uniref:Aste57867_3357 protein n=1 Tax=Aphanomyces stellatus TaxID=120398 RepID=A0A485KDC8_9STRA|nr:hypothetical protein As57867_003347 [Aphanomyces stellatus]VFT80525.1 Aste57867_3357 [Aphanomyces stellatus]
MPRKATKRAVGDANVDDSTKETPASILSTALSHEKVAEWKETLKKEWLFAAPDEFFQIHALAVSLKPDNPSDAFVEALGLRLTGPFDALSSKPLPTPVGTSSQGQLTNMLQAYIHGRSVYDPPEVLTVMQQDDQTFGYFRDAPSDTPSLIVQGSLTAGSFAFVGTSLAGVLLGLLGASTSPTATTLRDTLISVCGLPSPAPTTKRRKTIRSTAHDAAATDHRLQHTVASTLSGLGIVVPVQAKTGMGFRHLPTTGQALRALLAKPTRPKGVDELITRATIACDECDFGTALQLGLDLWSASGKVQYDMDALALLEGAYLMLKRGAFATLARAHMAHCRRRREP